MAFPFADYETLFLIAESTDPAANLRLVGGDVKSGNVQA